jgi:hypothetical protein
LQQVRSAQCRPPGHPPSSYHCFLSASTSQSESVLREALDDGSSSGYSTTSRLSDSSRMWHDCQATYHDVTCEANLVKRKLTCQGRRVGGCGVGERLREHADRPAGNHCPQTAHPKSPGSACSLPGQALAGEGVRGRVDSARTRVNQ